MNDSHHSILEYPWLFIELIEGMPSARVRESSAGMCFGLPEGRRASRRIDARAEAEAERQRPDGVYRSMAVSVQVLLTGM